MSLQRPLDAGIVMVGQKKATGIAKQVKQKGLDEQKRTIPACVDGRMEEMLHMWMHTVSLIGRRRTAVRRRT